MDVVGFFVTTGLGVYHTYKYVMDIYHAVMDLMKQIVVRYINVVTLIKSLLNLDNFNVCIIMYVYMYMYIHICDLICRNLT